MPEQLEDRALPGGSLLELLLGVPLATPFLGLTWADADREAALNPPGLNARRQEHLCALAELRSDSPLMDNVLEEVRRVLTMSSAEEDVVERYVAEARTRMGGVAAALAGSDAARLGSRDFLADLWWTEELLAGVGRAWGLQHRPFSSELPVEGDDPEGMATMGYGGYGNMPPVAVNDYYSTMHDVPLEVSAASGVLENDYDPNPGTTLTAICTGGPTHGALSLDPDGSFTYTPPDKWADTATFWYKASDGSLLSNQASVRITVMNNAPCAGSEYYTAVYNTPLVVPEADGVKRNDCDYDGDAFTVSVATPPSHGTVNLNATTGAFTYTPATNYVGADGFTYKARDGVQRADGTYYESYPATVSITVSRPYPDIDVDSDNNGVVDRNQYEENEEMNDPGVVIWWNIDDDNGNGVQDRSDPGPFVNPQGQPVDDNDLFPVGLSAPSGVPYYGNLKDFTLELSTSGNLALWKTRDKQALSTSYRIGTDPIPIQAFVEGTDYGPGQIDWILKNPAGTEISRDTVKVTVAWDNLTGYRPQTEGPGYGSPFPRTAVPANLAMTPGVGIRRNGDDDNGNQVADRLETGIQGENDLIEMMVSMIPNSSPGIQYWLKRYDTNLTVWDTATKTGDWFGTAMQRQVTPSASSAWVEWNTMNPIQTGADLSLYIWDATHQRVVPGSTVTLHFYPFTSVVIAFGGQGQDPLNPVGGTFIIAQELYEEGYDVHAYRESNMVNGYNEVVRAVQGRGVADVAIIGYSQGGGATYEMANNLNNNRAQIGTFTIAFTAYIDGVKHTGADPERRRPVSSAYHVNYYQPTPTGILSLRGDSVPTSDFDRNVHLDPWGAGLDHYTIDNHRMVIDRIKYGRGQGESVDLHAGLTDATPR